MARSLEGFGRGHAVLAFDVGGTSIKAALLDDAGTFVGLLRRTTPQGGGTPEAVIGALVDIAAELKAGHPDVTPVAAGVSAPGIVDESTGFVELAATLGWREAPILTLTERSLGLPVALRHDIRAASDAEFRFGIAAEYRSYIMVVIGTGIAGSLVLDGRPYIANGLAGELGHCLTDVSGEKCVCGARGCLETIASAGAIARRFAVATGRVPRGAAQVLDAARAGDPDAQRIWNEAIEALAQNLARWTSILAPEAVIVGGGLAEAGDDLFDPLRARTDALLSFHRRPDIRAAALGENAGLIGAALGARDLIADSRWSS